MYCGVTQNMGAGTSRTRAENLERLEIRLRRQLQQLMVMPSKQVGHVEWDTDSTVPVCFCKCCTRLTTTNLIMNARVARVPLSIIYAMIDGLIDLLQALQVYQAAITAVQQAGASFSPLLCVMKPDVTDPLLALHDLAALRRLRMEGAEAAIAHFVSKGISPILAALSLVHMGSPSRDLHQ